MKEKIKQLCEDFFFASLQCREDLRGILEIPSEVTLSKEVLVQTLEVKPEYLRTVEVFLANDQRHTTELAAAKAASSRKKAATEKTALEELVSSAIGYGLLAVYGLQDSKYSNMELGLANFVVRQAIDPSNTTDSIDNLRQFSGRALNVLKGIKLLDKIAIDYDKLIAILSQFKDKPETYVDSGRVSDSAKAQIAAAISESEFSISLKQAENSDEKQDENSDEKKAGKNC